MDEKKSAKITLTSFFLIISLIIIIVMGIVLYKLYNDKVTEINKSAELQKQVNSLNETVNDLQGKLNKISETINSNTSSNNQNESIDKKNNENSKITFSDDQIKACLSNYLELMANANCDNLLIKLTEKGLLNYDYSKDNYQTDFFITNIKFSDYKKAMLNFVSENEFEKNWHSTQYFGETRDGYLTKLQGGGACNVYTIKNITKNNDNSYNAQTSYITDESEPTPTYDKDFTFSIKSYNGNCVIDSIR